MRTAMRLSGLAAVLAVGGLGSGFAFQAPATGAAPAKVTCAVQKADSSEAAKALLAGRADDALRLYGEALLAEPASDAAMVGVVRANLAAGKLNEALELATKFSNSKPNDAALLDALGEARFRRGEVDEAGVALNKAIHLDICVPWVHADYARFQALNGNFLTAQKRLDFAHQLAPEDPGITREWRDAHSRRLSGPELVARLTSQMNDAKTSDEDKKQLAASIKRVQANNNGNCEAVDAKPSATIQMMEQKDPNQLIDTEVYSMGMDLDMNGKRIRLEVDSGASGLVITRAAAAKAGLVAEAEALAFGIGDAGMQKTLLTHVDKLRVGGMEFHNCEVEVLDKFEGFQTDGLVGPDVFARWLVTLDIPAREMRLSPLPKRPGEGADPMRLDVNGVSGNGQDSSDGPHDRYVAPEMKDWTQFFRRAHDIILPVRLNALPSRLFILDTGAYSGNLDIETGKQLGHLTTTNLEVRGISGYVKHAYELETPVMLSFAGIKQEIRGIPVFDMRQATGVTSVYLTGLVGFKTLRELVLAIDYRDNLLKVTFDPAKGFHNRGSAY